MSKIIFQIMTDHEVRHKYAHWLAVAGGVSGASTVVMLGMLAIFNR